MMLHRLPIRAIVLFCFSLSTIPLIGQSAHFSLHHMTPLAFNPANTGGFLGSYRIAGLYRDQYRTVSQGAAYMTPTFSADVNIIKGFKETDWVSVGLFFLSDKSGDGGLVQGTQKLSAAYHFTLNKKGNSIITLGYQFGGVGRKIKNPEKLSFEDDLINGPGGGTTESLIMDDKGKSFSDHVGGLKFISRYNKTDEFNIGFAMGRFGKPDWSLTMPDTSGGGGGGFSRYEVLPRMHAQIGMSTLMSDKMRFLPNVSYQRIMGTSESSLVVQGFIEYLYNEAKNTILIGGLGYRSGANIGDAAQIMLGAYIKDIRVMLAYDLNISSLSAASSTQGGFELAAMYIGKIYKRPNPDPVIFCPRF
jgi:type IX secretion system PorP/SprF family membrane protein